MSFCRWFAALFLLVGVFTLTDALLPVLAQDKKAEDKKAEDKKAEDKKAEDKKAEDKKAEDKKAEDKKAEDKKAEDKKAEDKKAEDKKAEDKKAEDKKAEDKKAPAADTGELKPEDFKAFTYVKDDQPLYQRIKTKTNQKMTVEKQQVTQVQDQTFFLQWTPLKGTDSEYVVRQRIIGVIMDIVIGSNKISYNSTEGNAASPMADFFKALKDVDLTFHLDKKTLTVNKVEGREEFIKKLAEAAPQMKNLLNNILSDDAIKQMAQPCWGAIPTAPKKKGDTWKGQTSKLNLGAIGSYDTEFDYTFDSEEKGKVKISIKPKMTYKAPSASSDKNDPIPFKIKEADTKLASVEGKESTGEAIFDRASGRIESSKMNLKLEGTLNIDVGGTETKVELKQEQESVMTILEPTDSDIQKMIKK